MREVKEHWDQTDKELDDKEWCKEDFVEKLRVQIEKVEQKWKGRESGLNEKTMLMVKKN